MADTTTRTLRLLSLLQRRRAWSGPELAERLAVSERTLRRDVDRLRSLGYAVGSVPGRDGGYRLEGAAGDTVLLLDDDESTALAAALHVAAAETSELAEAALGALTKVLASMSPQQRRRAEAVLAATEAGEAPVISPPLDTLDTVASACRDQVRLSFGYVSATGESTSRYVEAHRLVTVGRRWYLVAHDADRADWRTFRVDRIVDPVPTRNSYPSRPLPAEDLREFVRSGLAARTGVRHVVVETTADAAELHRRYGRWIDVEALDGGRCRLTMDTDSFDWPTHIVAGLDAPFDVIESDEFRDHLRAVAERLAPPRR